METYSFTSAEIEGLDSTFRRNFMNTLAGFKSANLIGTQNKEGRTNLAVFNSVVHIGANPPFMGFILRPHTVPRHTYENILATKHYTFNHIGLGFIQKAHQTAAKYAEGESEFEACGFTAVYKEGVEAPFVKESSIKIGLELEETHEVKCNQTILVVGRVLSVEVPKAAVEEDGFIRLEEAGTVAISGLDGYYEGSFLGRKEKEHPRQ